MEQIQQQSFEVEKQSKLKIFLLLVISIVIGLIGLYTSIMCVTIYHEQVHKTIFDSYGIPSDVRYNYLFFLNQKEWLGLTVPRNTTQYNEQCTEACLEANHINEAIGYHFNAALIVLMIMYLIYVFLIFMRSVLDPQGIKIYKMEKNFYYSEA